MPAIQARYTRLVREIEQRFAVAEWRSGDVDIWPLARMVLYCDMTQASASAREVSQPLLLRLAAALARPALNRWRARHDLAHLLTRPHPAEAIFLGDGVSLDCIEGSWHDRFGEPLLAALEKGGARALLMQRGGSTRLPWHRATLMTADLEGKGRLAASRSLPNLPQQDAVLRHLADNDVAAPSLSHDRLARQAALVSATATAFETILAAVKPRLAFVVNSSAGCGPAFALACRRRNILCVDVQRAPLESTPMIAGNAPSSVHGYSTVPALFWTWTQADAAAFGARGFPGGHTQLAAARAMPSPGPGFEREILVALQPVAGHRATWDRLAEVIAASPSWRWWIRRHSASTARQDAEFGRLLHLHGPNIALAEAAAPLPALLPHMDAVVSLGSGTAVEGAMFGVPAFFLSPDAVEIFPALIAQGDAHVVDCAHLREAIVVLPPLRRRTVTPPDLEAALARLERVRQNFAAGAFA